MPVMHELEDVHLSENVLDVARLVEDGQAVHCRHVRPSPHKEVMNCHLQWHAALAVLDLLPCFAGTCAIPHYLLIEPGCTAVSCDLQMICKDSCQAPPTGQVGSYVYISGK